MRIEMHDDDQDDNEDEDGGVEHTFRKLYPDPCACGTYTYLHIPIYNNLMQAYVNQSINEAPPDCPHDWGDFIEGALMQDTQEMPPYVCSWLMLDAWFKCWVLATHSLSTVLHLVSSGDHS